MFNSKYFIYIICSVILFHFDFEIGNFLLIATRATKLQCFRTNVSRVRINSPFAVANKVPDSISTNALTLFRDFQSETTGKARAFH